MSLHPATSPPLLPETAAGVEPDAAFLRGDSANLDFLRTFAVLLVVARHLMSVFGLEDSRWIHPQALGIFGVLLFFVHTSLVLMFSLERQQQRLGRRHFYTTFLVRRVFRIYPLSVAVVLALTAAANLLPNTGGLAERLSAAGLVANLLLVQDWAHQPNITGVLWSLPLEMQMYLFLPLLFLNAKKLGVSGLLWLWGGGAALGLLHAKFPALPGLFEYVSCFLPGVLCYVLSRQVRGQQTPSLPFRWFPLLLIILLAAYLAAYGVLHHGQALFGMPACLLLGVMLPRFRELSLPWLRGACKTVARYSYGLYLLHWSVIWLAFVFLHASPAPVKWLVFAAGLVLGPLLAYHAVEEPMIRAGNRVAGYIHRSRLTPQP